MKKKVAFFIDGWFMRKTIFQTKAFFYVGSEIRNYCLKHLRDNQEIYRIFYYDSEPLDKKGQNPISKSFIDFSDTNVYKKQHELFESIRITPNFALRLGKTEWFAGDWKINNAKLKKLINKSISIDDLKEKDFQPNIRQKGVDMKIGIDITLVSLKKLADIIILITGDQDIVPALKLARREGIIVGLDRLNNHVNPLLSEHVDFAKTFIT